MDIFVSLPSAVSPNNLGSGQAFLVSGPHSFTAFYPPLSDEPLKYQKEIDLSKVYSSNTIISWPVAFNKWIQWVNWMAKTKLASWSESSILHAILISQVKIPLDFSLLYSALMFWAPSFNRYLFQCGPIGPTIQDVSSLLGLLLYGEYFGSNYSLEGNFTYPKVETKGSQDWKNQIYLTL